MRAWLWCSAVLMMGVAALWVLSLSWACTYAGWRVRLYTAQGIVTLTCSRPYEWSSPAEGHIVSPDLGLTPSGWSSKPLHGAPNLGIALLLNRSLLSDGSRVLIVPLLLPVLLCAGSAMCAWGYGRMNARRRQWLRASVRWITTCVCFVLAQVNCCFLASGFLEEYGFTVVSYLMYFPEYWIPLFVAAPLMVYLWYVEWVARRRSRGLCTR